jgi:hypothetical protein
MDNELNVVAMFRMLSKVLLRTLYLRTLTSLHLHLGAPQRDPCEGSANAAD